MHQGRLGVHQKLLQLELVVLAQSVNVLHAWRQTDWI